MVNQQAIQQWNDAAQDRKAAKKIIGEARDTIGKPPPSGLIPRGNGWYTTPEVIKPNDCQNWPSSPYCGGNGLADDPDSGVGNKWAGIDIDGGFDGCSAHVSVSGSLAGIQLPTHTTAWIHPDCRQQYERGYDETPPPIEGEDPPSRLKFPNGIPDDAEVGILIQVDSFRSNLKIYKYPEWIGAGQYTAVSTTQLSVNSFNMPSLIVTNFGSQRLPPAQCWVDCTVTGIITTDTSGFHNQPGMHTSGTSPPYLMALNEYSNNWNENQNRALGYYMTTMIETVGDNAFNASYASWLLYGKYGAIRGDWEGKYIYVFGEKPNGGEYVGGMEDTLYERGVLKGQFKISALQVNPNKPGEGNPWKRHNKIPHVLPDKNRRRRCCVSCCNDSKQNQDSELLKRILKKVENLEKRVGVNEYPVEVPKHLQREYKEDGSIENPPTINIENAAQFAGWQIKALDSILGQWGVGFEIKDADPTKEGDQPGRISAPNLAELLTEMYAHIFDLWMMQYQQTQMIQRGAIETMLSKKIALQNNFLLDAVADYLGFHRKEYAKKIPFLLNINSEKLEDFMQNMEQEILVQEYEPDNKKNPSLKDDLTKLLLAASVIKGVYTRKFNVNGDMVSDIVKHLSDMNERTQKVNKNAYKTGDSDFDQWLREAENAFINKDPNPDAPTKPYGVSLDQRPRLKKIVDDVTKDE